MDNENVVFKLPQNSHFSEGSKIGNFVNVLFYAKYTAKKCLVTFWLKKQACLDNRNTDFKKGNLVIFSKGIFHDLVKKLIFSLSFLSKIDRGKVFVDVVDRKKAFKDKKNRFFMKNAKVECFQRGKSIIFVKSFRFLQLCFL